MTGYYLVKMAQANHMQQNVEAEIRAYARRKRASKMLCESCYHNPPDHPSRLCPGCQAYKEHQR